MGEDRPGAGAEIRVPALKPPAERLYGRHRTHRLRPRQQKLLEQTLPRLRFDPACAGNPLLAFAQLRANGKVWGEIRHTPLWLEVGFGSGEHALAQITAYPEVAYIACEVFENGICSLLSRLVPDGGEADAPLPPNLRLWDGDARTLLRLLPDASLDALFLLFPDPWPKGRHAKRRFVHPSLLPLIARVLRPGAEWRIASDDPTNQQWITEVLAAQSLFITPPPGTTRPRGWPPTRYEAKAIAAGRQPLYWSLHRL